MTDKTDAPLPGPNPDAPDADGDAQAGQGGALRVDHDDPLLTSQEAARRMGKTYKQFTAYTSHHKVPREGKGRNVRYRLSVIEREMGHVPGPLAVVGAGGGEKPDGTDKAEGEAVNLPVVFRGILQDKDRQIEQARAETDRARAELVAMAEAKGAALERARQAEQRLTETEQRAADLQSQMEAREQAAAEQTKQSAGLSFWQRLWRRDG